MKTTILYLCTSIAIILFSCSKESHSVQIRVINKTTTSIAEVRLGNESYGSLSPEQTSNYHIFKELTYIPQMNFYNGKDSVDLLIGLCGTGLPSGPTYLENGNYLYTITNDSFNFQGFGFSFVKE